jgi:amino acid adenylation domain-containing protein
LRAAPFCAVPPAIARAGTSQRDVPTLGGIRGFAGIGILRQPDFSGHAHAQRWITSFMSNRCEQAAAQARCIHQYFEAQARQNPDRIALTFESQQLSYAELNARANRLAARLQKLGVKPETLVGICAERSVEMVVGILGILKAGGAYVPVDPACPADRLAFILQDAAAPVLLTQKALAANLATLQGSSNADSIEVLYLDSEWDSISKESAENPDSLVAEENAAYVIYTSGSTGKPKGVTVTHKNVVRLFTATDHWFKFGPEDVWTLFHSYAFDFSVWEIWGALVYGGRLVVVPYITSRSPAAFYELLASEKVTVLNQTPSAFRQLIWAEATTTRKQSLNLRYVIFGGEALELQSLKTWFELHGDQRPQLINMYGITETTVHVTYRPITMADLQAGAGSVIGVPIPDLQLHILKDDLTPAAVCEAGEIFVGGLGVARGYLNRPELTAQRFIKAPFSSDSSTTLYRSGDLARRLPNGDLEYLGRIDHQVKIRGFRIELGEIESALNQHPAVRENIVIAQDHGDGNKRLVGYVVPKKETPSITELREHLGKAMPEYMIPAVFIFMESLPLTTNGKVDRAALPSPDRVRPTIANDFVEPRTSVEKTLATIWSEVLDVANVGVKDNFFELGGDSISSIAVLSKAQKRGVTFSLQKLFQNPTIEGLARSIESSTQPTTSKRTQPFSLISQADRAKLPEDVEDAYPMIQLQTGMFYYNEVNPLSAVYHDVFSFKINSVFDREKLEKAVNQLVQRHSVLRTSFHIAGYSEPMQLVHRSVKAPFTVEDVRQLSDAEQEQRTIDWIEVEKRNPFDRTVAPLLRFHTQLRSDNAFQFIVSFHHVYLDGWSLAALLTEIFQDYAALRQGTGETIAAPQITYREFVALEREAVAGDGCRNFWTNKLADAQVQMLPRWPKAKCAGGHEQKRGPEINIRPEVFDALKRICQKAGVPLKTVLLAAHQRVMAALYGQTDVVSGLVCNGRPEEIDGEKLIGLFLNTLPIRTKLEGGTWLDLVKQTFSEEQQIIPHRRFPLAEIQKLNGGQPVFEAAFDFVHFHVYKNLQAYGDMGFMEGHYFEANNLTTLTTFMLDVTSTNLQMHLDYDPNVISLDQVQQISWYYIHALEAMAAAPESHYGAASVLSTEEQSRMLRDWNGTLRSYPAEKCIHQLFEEQVRQNPTAIAVNCEGQQLTYAELNDKADRVAARLQAAGIRADMLVGVYVERSPEMIVGLLGVLKAGGAYVPLDPAYPQERLADMIADSEMRVILTQGKVASRLPQTSATIITFEELSASSAPAAFKRPDEKSNNLAYVIYTSGSTGKPKGVQIEHRSVVNLLLSIAEKTAFRPSDHLLAVTTFSFDIAALEMFMPLVCGAQLTIVPREVAADGTRLTALVDRPETTLMQATPATWRLLIEAGWKGKQHFKILCGGEALSRALADELLKRAGEVWNVYGPTETTIWSTAWRVQPDSPILIGQGLANTQLYILDKHHQPVPPGVVGELHIGGDGLARGYFKRPELTAEKFVELSLCGAKPVRVYTTGDLARFLPDGNVECLGRIDHQVKIRGYRIELGDIEAALRKHPAVREALVVAREDVPGDKRLVAYVVPTEASIQTSDLRDALKAKLPEFMVPSAVVCLEDFPLTPSGKIDRKALPSPTLNAAVSGRPFVAPGTPFETMIAGIWEEVFQAGRVGVEDNFFDLGGHSLLAIQIIVRIREKLGVDLPLSVLFEQPTVSGLAEAALNGLVQSVGGLDAALEGFTGIPNATKQPTLAEA